MSDILFVCVHTAGRSQMAKAFFKRLAEEAGVSLVISSPGKKAASGRG